MSILIFVGLMPIFYWYWQHEGLEKAQTMALATLVVYELFYAFNCRSLRFTLPQLGFFTNKWLLPAVLSSGLLMLAVIYIPSWGKAFHTVPLDFWDWDVVFIVAGASFLLVEFGKWFFGRKRARATVANSSHVAIAVKTEGGK